METTIQLDWTPEEIWADMPNEAQKRLFARWLEDGRGTDALSDVGGEVMDAADLDERDLKRRAKLADIGAAVVRQWVAWRDRRINESSSEGR